MNIRANNNLDFLRFSAATLVLFSHSFPLVEGKGTNEPLNLITGGQTSLGHIAVIIFFIISGFLISASWMKRKNFLSFIIARIKRIFPGLTVMLLVTVLCGYFLTKLDYTHYYQSAIPYFFINLILKGRVALADIFNTNPFGPSINGSLWTLRFEFTCYLIIAIFGVFGRFNRLSVLLLWAGAVVLLSFAASIPTAFFSQLPQFIAWFSAGMLVYLFRDLKLSYFIWLLFYSSVLVCLFFKLNLIYISPILAFILIKIAYKQSCLINFGKYGDFSYGIYIYMHSLFNNLSFTL